jgi:pullulanase/glycogen debranching enzyme
MNALWVRERRIERTGGTATLHTELGSWPLRHGVVPDDVPVREVLKGRLRVGDRAVQIAPVLDDLYDASAAQLGPTWRDGVPTVAVWAPTARDVRLLLNLTGTVPFRFAMERGEDGVWRVTGDPSWRDAEYAFEVTVYAPSAGAVVTNVVTDPYSVALTLNSTRSVLAELEPPGEWPKPPAAHHVAIYELHVRDFSISDATVPPEHRGTYLAFTHLESDGMRHLKTLAQAGMTHVHLLPVNDIATIEEDRAKHLDPGPLNHLAPASSEQQRRIGKIRDRDGFNWGYDPLHYSVPEGSYAVADRTAELRAMVRALNAIGLRVVLDVVYNHTPAAGQDARSILDRIVPGYYHRLAPNGWVESSTCCANTASEHRMMEKLMLDSLATWAREYRVDGFRFDLMGHHTKANLLKVRDRHPDLLLYGEGWSFGEVADDRLFVAASRRNMAGTGIATFGDGLRDAVRGGGPHDADPRHQGFASGLADTTSEALRVAQEEVMRGMAVGGDQIAYVDAHDNETLFDALALKLPRATTMDDRVRMNTLALATVTLSQSPCFWHAGTELLRSKSLDRNSYDSGDWFNRIDWTANESAFGSGLPPRWDNGSRWKYLRPLLKDPRLRPEPRHIRTARERALELLRIRASSPLFGGAEVRFEPGAPGVIVMVLSGELVVILNATPHATTQTAGATARRLHPALAERDATYADGAFTVPARTVAVFVP